MTPCVFYIRRRPFLSFDTSKALHIQIDIGSSITQREFQPVHEDEGI